MKILSPSEVWLVHRAALGGVAAISGDPLATTLADCKVSVQESHYAMALAAALRAGARPGDVALPPLVSPERAAELLKIVTVTIGGPTDPNKRRASTRPESAPRRLPAPHRITGV